VTVKTLKLFMNYRYVITYQGILNLVFVDNFIPVYVYVAYRRQDPDKATVKRVLKELQENNLDINQLTEYKKDHCPQAESSDEDEDENE
jgi:hypothetical protein